MESGIFIRTQSGDAPSRLLARIRAQFVPDQAAVRYAAERQRARILDRTARGVDVEGKAFAPYSTKGPYYHNPNGRLNPGTKVTAKQQKDAAKRFLGNVATRAQRKQPGAPGLSRTGRTVKFPSYAAFKQWLGRTAVDLRGNSAVHMLQRIQIKLTGSGGRVSEVRLGIYGPEAGRATGHNEGARHLPQRRFFGVSSADLKQFVRDITDHLKSRSR